MPVLTPLRLTLPVFEPANAGSSCRGLEPFQPIPNFYQLVIPADLFARMQGLPPFRALPEVQIFPTPPPVIGSKDVETIRVTSVSNAADGRKIYDLKVGGGPSSEPVISGKGGQLDASTYAGRGQVAGASVNARFYAGPDLMRLSHDVHVPIFALTSQNGVQLVGVFTQGARIEESSLGIRYAVSTGAGMSLRILGNENAFGVSGYHLEFGAAPSLTNASATGLYRASTIVPMATGTFGFDW